MALGPEIYAARRPRVGTDIYYRGELVGTAIRVEGALCWRSCPGGESLPFIWCFRDGLNTLHNWEGKAPCAEV